MKKKTKAKRPATKRAPRKATPVQSAPYTLAPGRALMLRTSDARRRSQHDPGFVWPESGPVEAPDWSPAPSCGGGLHGYLWGSGDAASILWAPDATWQVVEIALADVVDLGGKIKVPRGVVIYSGERGRACALMAVHAPSGTPIICGTATAGNYGTATAGDGGTATAGYRGTATAGNYGTATAGDGGTATAGHRGTATAGDGGTISILYYDPKRGKYRRAIAEVGENGIEPNTAYVVDADGRLVKRGGAK